VGVVEAKKVLAALAHPPLCWCGGGIGLRCTRLIGLTGLTDIRFAFPAKLVSAHARIANLSLFARARHDFHVGLYRVSRRDDALGAIAAISSRDELVRGNAEHGARAAPQARPNEEKPNTRLSWFPFCSWLLWLCCDSRPCCMRDARLAAPLDPVFSRIQNGVARRLCGG
jgi:hypothetical protein